MARPSRRSTEKLPLWPEADDYNNDDDSPPSYEEATGNSGGHPKHVPGKHIDEKMKSPGEKACAHWSASGCKLTLNPRRCCSCADERPWDSSGRYAMYADGKGWVNRAARWQYYCPGCRAACVADSGWGGQEATPFYLPKLIKEKRVRDHRMWEENYARTLADARFFGLASYVRKDKEAAEGFSHGNNRL
ncbi:hypothetical protein DL767_008219 [Monosporascus sp. MG133]|nr:hypothetical protein DL767_008219 [Monosporascus sp. MG133]